MDAACDVTLYVGPGSNTSPELGPSLFLKSGATRLGLTFGAASRAPACTGCVLGHEMRDDRGGCQAELAERSR